MQSFQGKPFLSICASFTLMAALASVQPVLAQNPPDNSGQNKQQSVTADQQSGATNDRQMTAQIRKQLMADKDLSTYAHNVKIIVRQGQVTLKGPVRTDDEKQKIQDVAAQVAGADKVTNDLSVKGQ